MHGPYGVDFEEHHCAGRAFPRAANMCCFTVKAACEYVMVVIAGATSIAAACAVTSIGHRIIRQFRRDAKSAQNLDWINPSLEHAALVAEDCAAFSSDCEGFGGFHEPRDRERIMAQSEIAGSAAAQGSAAACAARAAIRKTGPVATRLSMAQRSDARDGDEDLFAA